MGPNADWGIVWPDLTTSRDPTVGLFGLLFSELWSQKGARMPLLLSPKSWPSRALLEGWATCLHWVKGPLCGLHPSRVGPFTFQWTSGPCLKISHVPYEHGGQGGLVHMMHSVFLPFKAVRRLGRGEVSETAELWQIKLVLAFFSSRSHQERLQSPPKRGFFMSSEFLPVVKCAIDNALDQWLQGNGGASAFPLSGVLSGRQAGMRAGRRASSSLLALLVRCSFCKMFHSAL